MSTSPSHDERIAKMTFAAVYPHYVAKVEKKGRTRDELHRVIEWLTGFDEAKLQRWYAGLSRKSAAWPHVLSSDASSPPS